MLSISDREIGPDFPPYIIAEIGVNHDGSPGRAIELVEAAHHAGADAIKLQLFKTDQLLSRAARLAAYQTQVGETDPAAMLSRLEIDVHAMQSITQKARQLALHVIVTIFSLEMVEPARSIEWDAFKTASPDLINRPLIEALMNTGRPLLISTGASTLEEVRQTLRWLGVYPHLLLQCVSSYPTPEEATSLGGRLALLRLTPAALGYSDHTRAIDTGALAVASGACLLEKHLTYDRQASGPDHAASLNPEEFADYVRLAHRASRMRGRVEKCVLPEELEVRETSRQSLTTRHELPVGHILRREDLTIKRPGTGISPSDLDSVIGKQLLTSVDKDMPLLREHLD